MYQLPRENWLLYDEPLRGSDSAESSELVISTTKLEGNTPIWQRKKLGTSYNVQLQDNIGRVSLTLLFNFPSHQPCSISVINSMTSPTFNSNSSALTGV